MDTRMTGALRIHALVIIARVLVRIGATAEDISAVLPAQCWAHLG